MESAAETGFDPTAEIRKTRMIRTFMTFENTFRTKVIFLLGFENRFLIIMVLSSILRKDMDDNFLVCLNTNEALRLIS
jgi:hypothetical protein